MNCKIFSFLLTFGLFSGMYDEYIKKIMPLGYNVNVALAESVESKFISSQELNSLISQELEIIISSYRNKYPDDGRSTKEISEMLERLGVWENPSKVNKENLAIIVNNAANTRTVVDGAYKLLKGFRDTLTSDEKDSLIGKILLGHREDGYYGFYDFNPSYYLRNLIRPSKDEHITFSPEQFLRLIKGVIRLGNDIDNRFILSEYGELLSSEDRLLASSKVTNAGYLSIFTNIPHIMDFDTNAIHSYSKVRFIVHPFYRQYFDSSIIHDLLSGTDLEQIIKQNYQRIRELSEKYEKEKTQKPPKNDDIVALILGPPASKAKSEMSDLFIETLQLYNELNSFRAIPKSNDLVILVLPPANFSDLDTKYGIDSKEKDALRLYATKLNKIISGSPSVAYLETFQIGYGGIAQEDLTHLKKLIPPDAKIYVEGGYLFECERVAADALLTLGNSVVINLWNSSTQKSSAYTNLDLTAQNSNNFASLVESNREQVQRHFKSMKETISKRYAQIKFMY